MGVQSAVLSAYHFAQADPKKLTISRECGEGRCHDGTHPVMWEVGEPLPNLAEVRAGCERLAPKKIWHNSKISCKQESLTPAVLDDMAHRLRCLIR